MQKIDLMIVGAQKAGTTSLKNYLNEHPEILGHPQTEFPFFRDETEFLKGYEKAFKKYFTEGVLSDSKKVIAKNTEVYDNEPAIKRLWEHNPDCQIVFLVRNPVNRAYSSFTMEKTIGWIQDDYEKLVEVIKKNDTTHYFYRLFINLGLYVKHLEVLLKYFKRTNIHIYLYEEFVKNPHVVCKDIFTFLDLDNQFSPNYSIKYNVTTKARSVLFTKLILWLRNENNILKNFAKRVIPYKIFTKFGNTISNLNKSKTLYSEQPLYLSRILYKYFEPFNEQFEKLSGINIDEWKRDF